MTFLSILFLALTLLSNFSKWYLISKGKINLKEDKALHIALICTSVLLSVASVGILTFSLTVHGNLFVMFLATITSLVTMGTVSYLLQAWKAAKKVNV